MLLSCPVLHASAHFLPSMSCLGRVVAKLSLAGLAIMLVVVLAIFIMLAFLVVVLAMLVRLVAAMVSVGVPAVVRPVVPWIFSVDVVYVGIVVPSDGTIEVVGVLVPFPLLVVEHALELLVAVFPPFCVYVAIAANAVQIGEVDVQDVVSLYVAQS